MLWCDWYTYYVFTSPSEVVLLMSGLNDVSIDTFLLHSPFVVAYDNSCDHHRHPGSHHRYRRRGLQGQIDIHQIMMMEMIINDGDDDK